MRKPKGLTLVELLVIVAIIGTLVMLILPVIWPFIKGVFEHIHL